MEINFLLSNINNNIIKLNSLNEEWKISNLSLEASKHNLENEL